MSDITIPSNIEAALQAGREQIQQVKIDGFKTVVITPHTSKVHELPKEKLGNPRFMTARPCFHDAGAFTAYVNAFKDDDSRIFYSQEGVFTAVMDYHHDTHGVEASARHGDHTALLIMKRSPEWETWSGRSGAEMDQRTFAEFLEDNSNDLLTPDPETMLCMATGLQAKMSTTFRSAINQSNGTIQVQFDEEVQGSVRGTTQEIPTQFQVGLRPFMGCARYPIDCRLRYRTPNGNLRFHYKALHLDPITEAALLAVTERVRDETGITPALGSHNEDAFKRGI